MADAETVVVRSEPNAISDYSLWLGVPNLGADLLKTFDPAYTGHVHIFVIKTPPIFTTFYPTTHGKNFKAIMERMSTSFSGIPELTLNYQNQTSGFADRAVPHATSADLPFDTGTVRVLEFKGLPVHTMMRDWIENIGDPVSKIQDYKGRAGTAAGQLDWGLYNHTAAFIVCVSDPSHTKLQGRAHYITAASPVSITNEPFNWNSGEISIVDGYDLGFKGVLRYGDYIDKKAYELLVERKTLINYVTEASAAKVDATVKGGGTLVTL
jgi:hypothetical protein